VFTSRRFLCDNALLTATRRKKYPKYVSQRPRLCHVHFVIVGVEYVPGDGRNCEKARSLGSAHRRNTARFLPHAFVVVAVDFDRCCVSVTFLVHFFSVFCTSVGRATRFGFGRRASSGLNFAELASESSQR